MQWLLQSTSPQISNLCTIQVDRVRKFSNQNEKQAETVYATCFFLKDLHQALNLREEKGSEKMTWKRILENAGIDIGFFFALCCLGKIEGGAPFSQLHKSGNGSRVDRP